MNIFGYFKWTKLTISKRYSSILPILALNRIRQIGLIRYGIGTASVAGKNRKNYCNDKISEKQFNYKRMRLSKFSGHELGSI